MGVILSQKYGDYEKVIAYDSHRFNPAERNYRTIQKEGLGIMYGLKVFRHYIHGRHFTIVTDHSALTHIRNMQNQNSRLRKWAIILEEFDFEIIHKKGKNHLDADCLSRYFTDEEINNVTKEKSIDVDPPSILNVDKFDFFKLQNSDEELRKIINDIRMCKIVENYNIEKNIY